MRMHAYAHPCTKIPTFLYTYLPIYPTFSAYLPFYLSVYLPFCLRICASISLTIYLYKCTRVFLRQGAVAMPTGIHKQIKANKYTNTRVYVCMYVYIYIYIYIYLCISYHINIYIYTYVHIIVIPMFQEFVCPYSL